MKIQLHKLAKGAGVCAEIVGMLNTARWVLFALMVMAPTERFRLVAAVCCVFLGLFRGLFDTRYNKIIAAVEKRIYGRRLTLGRKP